jgi:hypothetical protein
MEVFWIVVVIVLLAALIGYVSYLYMKEAGPGSAVLWLTSSRLFRNRAAAAPPSPTTTDTARLASMAHDVPRMDAVETVPPARPLTTGQERTLVIDEGAVRELREEVQRELRAAVGRSREFDARLTRIEHTSRDVDVTAELAGLRETHRVEIERLQVSMEAMRRTSGAHGERQGRALADLYGHLARVESALAAVMNPMLLPGEDLTMPADLPAEALVWSNWNGVGDQAYAFGNVFNENRLLLESSTGDEIAAFISLLRQGLTGRIYPAIRNGNPSADQVAQLRAGLQTIVDALPAVRRRIEDAYREGR